MIYCNITINYLVYAKKIVTNIIIYLIISN